MQPSTSSATSATTMEVSTFQTLEDAKPQANRKRRISFSKIKIFKKQPLLTFMRIYLGMKFILKFNMLFSVIFAMIHYHLFFLPLQKSWFLATKPTDHQSLPGVFLFGWKGGPTQPPQQIGPCEAWHPMSPPPKGVWRHPFQTWFLYHGDDGGLMRMVAKEFQKEKTKKG